MVDAVQAGRGVVDYPGLYPIQTGYVLGNTSGVTALPVAIPIAGVTGSITINTSIINGGVSGQLLYDNAGTVGETPIIVTAGGAMTLPAAGVLTLPQGTPAAPTLTWTGSTIGFFAAGGSSYLTSGAVRSHRFYTGGSITLSAGGGYYWSSTSDADSTADLLLVRDAGGVLAQRDGANVQTLRVYNTYTDASNYERLSIGFNGSTYNVGTEAAGTGTGRYLNLIANGSPGLSIFPTPSAVNYWQFTPTATGAGSVTRYIVGSDANISEYTVTKGTGSHNFSVGGSSSNIIMRVDGTTTTPVNYAYIRGSATLNAVQYGAAGTDTNIDVSIFSKGSGAIQLNQAGGTVLALEGSATTLGYSTSFAFARPGTSGTTLVGIGNQTGSGYTSTALNFVRITPAINQASGTYVMLDINPTETAIGAGPHYLIRGRIGAGADVFTVRNDGAVVSNSYMQINAGSKYYIGTRGGIGASADGVFNLVNNAGTDFSLLQFGGTTSSFPAIKRVSGNISFRRADDGGPIYITSGGSQTTAVAVASLPAAASWAGMINYVTDATATTSRSIVAGGGANKVMVWSDGTNWLIF